MSADLPQFATEDEEGTAAVGRELARSLGPGSVVLLTGDLGAGKTAFVRGLAEGLGVAPGEISSPTFTLVQEYRGGRVPLVHADLYRIHSAREIEEIGLEEYGDAVLAVEWADRLARMPPGAIRVDIAHGTDSTRHITIRSDRPSEHSR
jgi:tRNA threonylcarbamoyladenosine biosynthesis protein TsaE